MNEELKNLFLPEPMVSFRSVRKLNSYLVRAKLYPLHLKVGSKKCATNCSGVCKYLTDTDTFASFVTGESFKISHQLNCDEKCIIYLLTCKQCQKQYTRKTTDNSRSRWNNGKFDWKESCMQEHIYIHFNSQVTWDSLMMYQLHYLTK